MEPIFGNAIGSEPFGDLTSSLSEVAGVLFSAEAKQALSSLVQ